jgi:uncharacterized protein (DUF433 family)
MSVLHRDPETLSGAPVFKGTRVLLENLFDTLKTDEALEEFLAGFPGVSKEIATMAIQEAQVALTEKLRLDNKVDRRS